MNTSPILRPSSRRGSVSPFLLFRSLVAGLVLLLGGSLAGCGGEQPGDGAAPTEKGAPQSSPSEPVATQAPAVQDTTVQDAAAQTAPTKPAPPKAPALEGFHIGGRVVDPWNDRVSGATVRVVPLGSGEEGETIVEGLSDEQGNYQFELPGPGPFQMYARHERGFDLQTTYTLDEGVVNKMKDLRLAGEGQLGGRVLDAAGKPVYDTIITAFHRDLLHQVLLRGDERFDLDTYPIAAPTLEGAFYEPGRGFTHGIQVTDQEGRFYFKGMLPGDYLFYCSALGSGPWMGAKREWHQTDALGLELKSKICILEVGVGLDGLPGSITGNESNPRRLGPVEVFPSVDTEVGPRPLLGRAVPAYGGERNVFGLEPGHYFVRATTYPPAGLMGGTMHVETEITLNEGDSLRRADLVFPSIHRPTGRLRVTSESPEGWDPPTGFHLMTPGTLQELECSEHTPYPEMRFDEWLDVPEGEYVIALLPFEDYVGQPGVVDLAPCYRRVRVVAGQEVESTLRGVVGGRMRVSLDADRFVLGEDIVFPDDMLDGDKRALMSLFEQTIGAVITVVREGEGPALKLRLRDKLNRLTPERRSMLPGEVMENFVPLEPGEYSVWAQAPGFEINGAGMTITSGETSEVTVEIFTP